MFNDGSLPSLLNSFENVTELFLWQACFYSSSKESVSCAFLSRMSICEMMECKLSVELEFGFISVKIKFTVEAEMESLSWGRGTDLPTAEPPLCRGQSYETSLTLLKLE